MVRFLHTADWQLGMTRHFLDGEAQARFSAARLDAVRAIGQLAVDQGCGFVVVGGDVFETNHVERTTVVRALDAMAATPQVTFFLLPGNHDPLDASAVLRSPTFVDHRPGNVVVVEDPGILPVEASVAGAEGVELVAAPWFSKRPVTDLVAAQVRVLSPAPEGVVRIVLGHGGVDVLSPDPTNPTLVRLVEIEDALAAGLVHYVALGDRHSTTAVGDSGRVWYSGAPEPTRYDEVDPGNVLVVELSPGSSPVVTPHRVGTWRFVRETVDVTGAADVEALRHRLDTIEDKARTIVKLSLVGQLSLADMAALESLLDHHADLFGALERWERRSELTVLPDDADLARLGLSGFAREALDDLQAMADLRTMTDADHDRALVARDALGLLYRLGSATA